MIYKVVKSHIYKFHDDIRGIMSLKVTSVTPKGRAGLIGADVVV